MPRSRVGKALTRAKPKTHGSFAEGAAITDAIMRHLQGGSRWIKMGAVKREAAHMIVHKLHRIVTGDPNHADHWDDIGGYAQLGSDDCTSPAAVKRRVKKKPAVIARLEAVPPKEKKPVRKVAKKKVTARPAKKLVGRAKRPAPDTRATKRRVARAVPAPVTSPQTQEAAE